MKTQPINPFPADEPLIRFRALHGAVFGVQSTGYARLMRAIVLLGYLEDELCEMGGEEPELREHERTIRNTRRALEASPMAQHSGDILHVYDLEDGRYIGARAVVERLDDLVVLEFSGSRRIRLLANGLGRWTGSSCIATTEPIH